MKRTNAVAVSIQDVFPESNTLSPSGSGSDAISVDVVDSFSVEAGTVLSSVWLFCPNEEIQAKQMAILRRRALYLLTVIMLNGC